MIVYFRPPESTVTQRWQLDGIADCDRELAPLATMRVRIAGRTDWPTAERQRRVLSACIDELLGFRSGFRALEVTALLGCWEASWPGTAAPRWDQVSGVGA